MAESESTKVIKVARELISMGWCKYSMARDKYRHPTDLFGERVAAVSINGALTMALTGLKLKNRPRTEKTVFRIIRGEVENRTPNAPYWYRDDSVIRLFNDSVARNRQDVLEVFDSILEKYASATGRIRHRKYVPSTGRRKC